MIAIWIRPWMWKPVTAVPYLIPVMIWKLLMYVINYLYTSKMQCTSFYSPMKKKWKYTQRFSNKPSSFVLSDIFRPGILFHFIPVDPFWNQINLLVQICRQGIRISIEYLYEQLCTWNRSNIPCLFYNITGFKWIQSNACGLMKIDMNSGRGGTNRAFVL